MTHHPRSSRALADRVPSWRRKAAGVLSLTLALMGLSTFLAVDPPATAAGGGLDEIGVLPFGYDTTNPVAPGLMIDDVLHRGFVINEGVPTALFAYDLVNLKLIRQIALPVGFHNAQRTLGAVDTRHHRVFFSGNPETNSRTDLCKTSPLYVVDSVALTIEKTYLPCLVDPADGIVIDGMSYDAESDKLYVVGVPAALADPYLFGAPFPKQPTFIAQYDGATLKMDWQLDASPDCDWHQGSTTRGGFIGRIAAGVVVYCLQGGVNANAGGARGALLSILLDADNNPIADPTTGAVVRTAPTYVDAEVIPIADRTSNRVLMISRNVPNGPAAWVFDPVRNLFVGVLPTGIDPNKYEGIDYGFDSQSGRMYIHTSRGFVLADARHTPLPGGVSYPAAVFPIPPTRGAVAMSTDGGLRRIFMPNEKRRGWLVFEDNIAPPPPFEPPDPDAGTADIPEVAGETDRSYSSAANAFGVHILHQGGIPSALEAYLLHGDCAIRSPNLAEDQRTPCIASTLVSEGNREYFVGQSALDLGLQSGTTAFGTAGRVAPTDFATNSDVRAAGMCHQDRLAKVDPPTGERVRESCPEDVPWAPGTCYYRDLVGTATGVERQDGEVCPEERLAEAAKGQPVEGVTFTNFKRGTAGAEGEGYPIPGAYCSDFGDTPGANETTKPSPHVGRSSVACDAKASKSEASGLASGFSFAGMPEGVGPLTVAESSSSSRTYLDPKQGLVTVATAVARGVNIGGLVRIGEIRTEATTSAKGRSKTTTATFKRTIEGVIAGDFKCDTACPLDKVVAAMNQVLGTKVTVRIPDVDTVATPRGFTGLVAKDQALATSDSAINDDTTMTANGLDVIFYNDYNRDKSLFDGQQVAGRNRVILSFAGVQAEAHYGVFPLPDQGDGTFGGGGTINSVTGGLVGGLAPGYSGSVGTGSALPRNDVVPAASGGGFPYRIIGDALRLFVNSPGQAALLAVFLGILATPIYLAIRRRSFLNSVV